jgi:hypothetical protein
MLANLFSLHNSLIHVVINILYRFNLIKVMDDCSWMYRDSPKGLIKMDYCNGIQGFINHVLFNP